MYVQICCISFSEIIIFLFLFTWKIIDKMVIIIIKQLKRKKKFEYFKNLEEYDTSDIILYLKSLIEIFAYYGY